MNAVNVCLSINHLLLIMAGHPFTSSGPDHDWVDFSMNLKQHCWKQIQLNGETT